MSIYKSEFLSKGIKTILINKYIKILVAFPLCAVIFRALYISSSRLYDGLKEISLFEIIVSLLIGLLISIVIIIVLPILHRSKKVIVGFNFNYDSRVLIIQSCNLFNSFITDDYIDFANIEILHNSKYYDGVTYEAYEVIEIYDRYHYKGTFILNHFTWDYFTCDNIKLELKDILSNPETAHSRAKT